MSVCCSDGVQGSVVHAILVMQMQLQMWSIVHYVRTLVACIVAKLCSESSYAGQQVSVLIYNIKASKCKFCTEV